MPSIPSRRRLSTRVLLVCGALGAVHLLLHLATVPLLTALAPLSPPLYGLLAGVHSVMPFLARRLTGVPGTAVLTSAIAALFVIMSNGSGLIGGIPVVLAGAVIDLVVWRSNGRRAEKRYLLAAAVVGTVLFALSLSVFSPAHLTPLLIAGTWVGRVVGEIAAMLLAKAAASALRRAGVGRALHAGDQSRPAS